MRLCVCMCMQEENGNSSDGEVKTNGMENGIDQQNGECVNGLYKVRVVMSLMIPDGINGINVTLQSENGVLGLVSGWVSG